MGLIIPNTYTLKIEKPVIFLAGPIKGAPNWQEEAIDFLLSQNSDLWVASPRGEIRESLRSSLVPGNDSFFQRQRAWEKYYLGVASSYGAILFWLPGEVEHNCAKSYGAMTRKELGEWSTAHKFVGDSVHFCVGTDGKFSEVDTILF